MIFTTTTLWVICNNGSRLYFKLVELKAPKSHYRHFFSYMNCWRNWPPLKTPTIKSVSRDLKLFLHSLLKVCMSSHDVSTPMVDLRQEGKSRFTTPALVYKRILEEIMTNKWNSLMSGCLCFEWIPRLEDWSAWLLAWPTVITWKYSKLLLPGVYTDLCKTEYSSFI